MPARAGSFRGSFMAWLFREQQRQVLRSPEKHWESLLWTADWQLRSVEITTGHDPLTLLKYGVTIPIPCYMSQVIRPDYSHPLICRFLWPIIPNGTKKDTKLTFTHYIHTEPMKKNISFRKDINSDRKKYFKGSGMYSFPRL